MPNIEQNFMPNNSQSDRLMRPIDIPGLRIRGMFSWALPSGQLGGLAGAFYRFANSIPKEIYATSAPLP
jgi:hypothetical protein